MTVLSAHVTKTRESRTSQKCHRVRRFRARVTSQKQAVQRVLCGEIVQKKRAIASETNVTYLILIHNLMDNLDYGHNNQRRHIHRQKPQCDWWSWASAAELGLACRRK